MAENPNHDAFVKAYNNFDSQPLRGERLEKFYIDDFTKDSTDEITTTIRITERFRKMLVIGHRGCGKSTILNKVAEDLKSEYHIVSFSTADELNMMDVETVDILLTAYLQVLASVKRDSRFTLLFKALDDFMDIVRKEVKMEEAGVSLLGALSFKFKVEPESRAVIRQKLQSQITIFQENLSKACREIQEKMKKDVLIIIDDLDKLKIEATEQIFFENFYLLTLTEAKIIYTFPLDAYYHEAYTRINDRYEDQFIPLVNLYDSQGQYRDDANMALAKLVLRRMDKNLIEGDALKYLIDMSGGLLRDLVKFMQDVCKLAIVKKQEAISLDLAKIAVNKYIKQYDRVFDAFKYADKVHKLVQDHNQLEQETLVYLLRHLFVLEYSSGQRDNIRYIVHPCLHKLLGTTP